MNKTILAALTAAAAWTAAAGIDIDIDLKAKPIKDMKGTANGIAMGVNGAMEAWLSHVNGNDDILFVSNRVETARIFREAGLRVMRLQGMNTWFNNRSKRTKDGKYPLTNPKAAFDFYQAKHQGVRLPRVPGPGCGSQLRRDHPVDRRQRLQGPGRRR